MNLKRLAGVVFLIVLGFAAQAGAGQYANTEALAGLQTAKVYFDVNVGDPKQLLVRFKLLDQTVRQIDQAGVKPEVVVGFRGGATRLVTRGESHFKEEEKQYSQEIKNWIADFKSKGFVLEQCAIATDFLKIDPADILPEITVVANGFVSMVGYQNKGYGVVPMD